MNTNNREISGNVLELADQIRAATTIGEDGVITVADHLFVTDVNRAALLDAVIDGQQSGVPAGVFNMQMDYSPGFFETVDDMTKSYLRGTYVLKHKGRSRRRHALRNDGVYIDTRGAKLEVRAEVIELDTSVENRHLLEQQHLGYIVLQAAR